MYNKCMLKIFTTLGFFFFLIRFASATETLKPFTTDFCTGYREGTHDEPMKWAHCCIEHDLNFWVGGTANEREQADLGLKQCVTDTGEPQQAHIIYMGVRLGYYSPYHIEDKRWGNGWYDRTRPHYQKISAVEFDLIKNSLSADETVNSEILEKFLESLNHRSH